MTCSQNSSRYSFLFKPVFPPQFITGPWRVLTQVRKVALKRDPLSLSASLPSAARGRTAETRLPNGQCQFFPSPCVPGTSPIKKGSSGVYVVVQWLRLHAPHAGDPGSIPDQGARHHMLQLRVPMRQNNVATAKTQGSQIIFFFLRGGVCFLSARLWPGL